MRRLVAVVALGSAAALVWRAAGPAEATTEMPCPPEMADAGSFCIDRFEAAVEVLDGTSWSLHPHNKPLPNRALRARSENGLFPQAHVSRAEAAQACVGAGKRLCSGGEWKSACKGTPATTYPYGMRRRAGLCNDRGVEPLARVFKGEADLWGFEKMNDPRLLLVQGTIAASGLFARCRGDQEVFDMVGNLHEWTSEEGGTLRGGFFLDTETLGAGCDHNAVGHNASYRDYSTGFRCCRDR